MEIAVSPTTRASVSALCLRDYPDHTGLSIVKNERGIFLRVPTRVGYNLRRTRKWVGMCEIFLLPSLCYVYVPGDGTVQIRKSLERGRVGEDILKIKRRYFMH